jgi:NADH-quinone oxidoreductase subunit F
VWLLEKLERGEGTSEDLDLIEHLYREVGPNSFCAHAAGAAEPVTGLYKHFRGILEAHVSEHGCPFGAVAVGAGVGVRGGAGDA